MDDFPIVFVGLLLSFLLSLKKKGLTVQSVCINIKSWLLRAIYCFVFVLEISLKWETRPEAYKMKELIREHAEIVASHSAIKWETKKQDQFSSFFQELQNLLLISMNVLVEQLTWQNIHKPFPGSDFAKAIHSRSQQVCSRTALQFKSRL